MTRWTPATFLLLAVAAWGCGGGADGGEPSANDGAASAPEETPASAPADLRSINEIAGEVDWPSVTPTPESLAAARDAVSSGMAIGPALEAAAPHAGFPKQAGDGTVNWLVRDDAGACVNLMLTAAEGEVSRVDLTTFPAGSMGEAKCQNFGV